MGLFDRSSAGHKSPPTEVTLEPGAVRYFSETIGETNPIHTDTNAARAAGHPDIVAPATYAVVVGTLASDRDAREGRKGILERIGANMHHLLHGTESHIYHGLLFAGDTVHVVNEVTGFTDASGGKLEIARITQRISHPDRGLLVEATRDLIHRLG